VCSVRPAAPIEYDDRENSNSTLPSIANSGAPPRTNRRRRPSTPHPHIPASSKPLENSSSELKRRATVDFGDGRLASRLFGKKEAVNSAPHPFTLNLGYSALENQTAYFLATPKPRLFGSRAGSATTAKYARVGQVMDSRRLYAKPSTVVVSSLAGAYNQQATSEMVT